MIASARELGLGEEHDGILRLASLGLDPAVGTDATVLLGLDDWAVEINVTPDRGYALSIRGVAREYAHATGAAFRDPAGAVTPVEASGFDVEIDDRRPVRGRVGASVFVTRVVRGIDPGLPSPAWLVGRLKLAGIRPISLIVDITNYVMIELGQPIHGYDLDTLSGGIRVRRAEPGEKLETLDGATRSLDREDLLITDDSGPIGLAGVMGGAATEIGPTTSAVLIEAANFDPVSIARSARRHKLPSEASRRFERGVDPEVAAAAAARVVELLEQLAGGTAASLGSHLVSIQPRDAIVLPDGYVNAIVGADYSEVEILRTLTDIGGVIEPAGRSLSVVPPTWRPDLTDKATLVEEVARIVGYDRIPAVLPTAPPGRGLTRPQRLRRSVSQLLAATGHTEILSYPFVSATANAAFGGPTDAAVPAMRLVNPLDAESPFLRTSLIPGLVEIARRNLSRGLTDLALFEIGSVFRPEAGVSYGSGSLPSGIERPTTSELAQLFGSIPPQPLYVSAIYTGAAVTRQPGRAASPHGIVDALDAARQVAHALHLDVTVRQGSHHSFHPGRTAELVVRGTSVGFAGELLPALAEEFDLPRVTAVLELDLGLLIELASADVEPTPLSSYPAATQDLSLVVGADAPAREVLDAVIEGAGELLEHASLVDDYRGAGLPDGSKSLTFALRFRATDRTLTAAEATEAKLGGAGVAAARFGAAVRE
jgi:phenylalanyl-tRNA synthetase beta chain